MVELISNGEKLGAIREKLNATLRPYASRAEFEASSIPSPVTLVNVIEAGSIYQLIRDPAGDWQDGGGSKWSAMLLSALEADWFVDQREQAEAAAGVASASQSAAAAAAASAIGAASDAASTLLQAEAAATEAAGSATAAAGSASQAASANNYASRALAVTAATSSTWPVGAVIRDGSVSYRYVGYGTAISDMPGWVPYGDVYPDHWAENIAPGTTDLSAALTSCAAYGDVHLLPASYYVATSVSLSTRPVYFADGAKLHAADGATITISGKINATDRQHIFEWTGAGAFSVNAQAYVSICWFGAVLGYTADAGPATQKAVDAISTGNIMIPAGAFRFDTAVTVAKSNIAFRGYGRSASYLRKGSLTGSIFVVAPADPITETLFDIYFSDMSFNTRAGDIHTAGTYIHMTAVNRYTVNRVVMHTPYNGLITVGCINGMIDDIDVIHIGGTAGFSSNIGVGFLEIVGRPGAGGRAANVFVRGVRVRSPEVENALGITDGMVITASDGIWFSECYIGSCVSNDLKIQPQTTTSQVSGLKFDNCWFDPTLASGASTAVRITGETSAAFGHFQFANCTFGGRNWSTRGLYFMPSGASTMLKQVSVVNCRILAYRNQGIAFTPTTGATITDVVIADNILRDCASTSVNNIPFVALDGVSRYSVTGNQIGFSDKFSTPETVATSSYGLTISSTCSAGIVTGNDLRGNGLGSISDGSGTATRIIRDNLIDTSNVVASASTITIPAGIVLASVTGTTTINNISVTWAGRPVILTFTGVCTVASGGNIKVRSAFTSSAGSSLSLVFDGTNWIETARAI